MAAPQAAVARATRTRSAATHLIERDRPPGRARASRPRPEELAQLAIRLVGRLLGRIVPAGQRAERDDVRGVQRPRHPRVELLLSMAQAAPYHQRGTLDRAPRLPVRAIH